MVTSPLPPKKRDAPNQDRAQPSLTQKEALDDPHPKMKAGEFMKASRDKRIKKETKRLNGLFSMLEQDKIDVAQGLIDEAAFMRITLEDLKAEINESGTIDIMPQGEYSIRRQSPEVQTYNTTIQRYTTVYKELFSLLPKEKADLTDSEFDDF